MQKPIVAGLVIYQKRKEYDFLGVRMENDSNFNVNFVVKCHIRLRVCNMCC